MKNGKHLNVCVERGDPGKLYIMGTKCAHKDGNIWNLCPCGYIFWSPWGKQL